MSTKDKSYIEGVTVRGLDGLTKETFVGCDFSRARIAGSVKNLKFYFCDFSEATFDLTKLRNCRFYNCDFTEADFLSAHIKQVQIIGSNMGRCVFDGCRMDRVLLKNCVARWLQVHHCKIKKIIVSGNFMDSSWRGNMVDICAVNGDIITSLTTGDEPWRD